MTLDFVYGKTDGRKGIVLFTLEDRSEPDYQDIERFIGRFFTLLLARKVRFFPFGYKEKTEDIRRREDFHFEDWLLIAAETDESKPLLYASAFIVHRQDPTLGFVVDLTGCQIEGYVHGAWGVLGFDGEIVESNDVLAGFQARPKPAAPAAQPNPTVEVAKPTFEPNRKGKVGKISGSFTKKPAPVPEPEEEAEEEDSPAPQVQVQAPAFEPNRKGKIGKISGSFAKKPAPVPEPQEPEEEDEDSPARPIQVQTPAFVAGSSKKPKNLNGLIPVQPIEEEEDETPQIHVETPSFDPVSSSKPVNINDSNGTWRSRSRYVFIPDEKRPNMRMITFDWEDDYALEAIDARTRALAKLTSLTIHDYCIFVPSVPDGNFFYRRKLRAFNIDEWNLLSMNIDGFNVPTSILLSLKEKPEICIVISPRGLVYAFSFQGVALGGPLSLSFQELLARLDPPKPKPKPVEPESEEKPAVPEPEVEVKRVAILPEAKPDVILTPKRRVFITGLFDRARSRFIDKYHGQAEADFNDTIKSLITLDEHELEAFLRAKDAKPITSRNGVTIFKFQFGTSREYIASRLFYCRGYDVSRDMDSSDFVLLGMTDQGEHEDQTEAAALFARMFNANSDLSLYQQLLPETPGSPVDELAYMSRRQFQFLRDAQKKMPMAFLGSAGTGKTLISISHCIALRKEGRRVLYLTYQKTLCESIRKTLKELHAEDVEAMTYRELCIAIFGEDVGAAMRTKDRYRKWFFDFAERNPRMRPRLKEVGPTPEDQFMICYVFYRGIIDGSILNAQKREGEILTAQEFFDLIKKEEGFTQAAKQTIYDVALAYEKHLANHHGTTDNKLASRILSFGERLRQYDAIVVDEFQDLSELQFKAILRLLRPEDGLRLFIYGDENQAINPTIFGFDDANAILRGEFGPDVGFFVTQLNDSYRSGPNLVHYINDVNRVKRKAIGAKSFREDEEVSLREDEEDLFSTLVEGEDSLDRLIEICAASDKEVAFLFPTALREQQARQKYEGIAKGLTLTSFFSVEKAKGMEWDAVVLVDFFSSSKQLFDAMIGEERAGRHSTVHRMLFNRFYVALTRGKNRIVVCESDVTDLIREKLLDGLTKLDSIEGLRSYFQGMAESESWQEFGQRLFAQKNYRGAYRALSRLDTPEAHALSDLCLGYIKAGSEESTYEESRDFYLSQADFEMLLPLYEERGEFDRIRFVGMTREKEADPEALSSAFAKLSPSLTPLEKKTFFALAARKICERANDHLSSILGGNDHE